MATGLVNPYAVAAAPNTRYRDAVLADSPLGLWMLDEPYGNNVAANQGSLGSAYDGLYAGKIATDPLYRGSGTVFDLDAMGRNLLYSNTNTGMDSSYVVIPSTGNSLPQLFPNNTSGNTAWTIEYLSRRMYNWAVSQHEWVWSMWHPINVRYFQYTHIMDVQSSNNTYKSLQNNVMYGRNVNYHMVLTFDGSYLRSYLNGAYLGAVQWASGYTGMQMTPNRPVMIGNGSATSYFRGLIAGAAIYNTVLTQAQVTAHYNALL